jgi:hypothetical protein
LSRLRFSAPVAAVAFVYAATLAMLPSGGLWIIDNGNKRIQVEALLASGFRDFSLPWPGRELDPELASLAERFSVVHRTAQIGLLASSPPRALCTAARLRSLLRIRGRSRPRWLGAGPRAAIRSLARDSRGSRRRLWGARRRGGSVRRARCRALEFLTYAEVAVSSQVATRSPRPARSDAALRRCSARVLGDAESMAARGAIFGAGFGPGLAAFSMLALALAGFKLT